jgi:hypothetical protein
MSIFVSHCFAGNNAGYVSQSVPLSMNAGQFYSVSVSMKNSGDTTWTAANSHRLGSQNPQDNGNWGTGRVYLSSSESIAPGGTKTFSFSVRAPASAGTYNFQWRMLREGVEWFGGYTQNIAYRCDGTKCMKSCSSDGDCNDGQASTLDVCDGGFCRNIVPYTIQNLFIPVCKGASLGLGFRENDILVPGDTKVDVYLAGNYITSSFEQDPAVPSIFKDKAAYVECLQFTGSPWTARFTIRGQNLEQLISSSTVSSTCFPGSSCIHEYSIQTDSVSYNLAFNDYRLVNGKYIVCPGASMSISDLESYNFLCNNGAPVFEKGANLVAWVYDDFRRVTAKADNGITPASRFGQQISSYTGSCIHDAFASSMSLSDFSSPGRYTVYVDLIKSYCNSPSVYIRSWANLRTYNVLVPRPAVSIWNSGDIGLPHQDITPQWTIYNSGVGDARISITPICPSGWSCRFIGYTAGSPVTLSEWASYTVTMLASSASQADTRIGIRVAYEDAYDLPCDSSGTQDNYIYITNFPGTTTTTTTTTTSSSTTTTFAMPGTKTVSLKYKLSYHDPETLFNCTIATNIPGNGIKVQNQVKSSPSNKYVTISGVPSGMYRWTVNCSDGVHNVYPLSSNAPRGTPKGYWIFYVTA